MSKTGRRFRCDTKIWYRVGRGIVKLGYNGEMLDYSGLKAGLTAQNKEMILCQ